MDKEQKKIQEFDSMFCNQELQKLKILFFYLDSPYQHGLAVAIKLQECLQLMKDDTGKQTAIKPFVVDASTIEEILQELYPFCNLRERSQLETLSQTLSQIQQYQDILALYQNLMDSGLVDIRNDMDFSDMENMMQILQQFNTL